MDSIARNGRHHNFFNFCRLANEAIANNSFSNTEQARTEVFTDLMNTLTESGINYQELVTTSQGDEQETAAQMNFAHSMLWVFENDFLQYRLGLVDETLWTSKLNILIANFSSCLGRAVFNQRKIGLDKNFVALMEDNLPADCLTDDEILELLRVPG